MNLFEYFVKDNTVTLIILLIFFVNYCVAVGDTELEKSGPQIQDEVEEGRTYAHHFAKRMAVLLLPLMFKLGVVMTMLTFLTFISIKSLIVGVGLMVVGLSHVLARAYQSATNPSQPPVSPIIISPGLFRQPPPAYVSTGWERRSGVTPRAQDPYKGYNAYATPDLSSAATSSQSYYLSPEIVPTYT